MPRYPAKPECVCQVCEAVFHAPPSAVQRGGGKFCSQDCYRASYADGQRAAKVDRVCEFCGRAFSVWPTRVRTGRAYHCSKPCSYAGRVVAVKDRFARRVGPPTETGCTLWTGHVDGNGYGHVVLGKREGHGRSELAHRAAWILANGTIPGKLYVLHDCPGGDNRACVNVAHLWLGTHADNMADMTAKGRQARGERAGRAKLTADTVKAIRARYAQGGITHVQLAAQFATTEVNVCAILSGRTWKHLLPE